MNRTLPTYADAVQRVKIGYFTEHLGLDITGVIHVGTNYGYEVHWYLNMGIPADCIIGFEPLPEPARQFRQMYPCVPLYNIALGESDRTAYIIVVAGDGQGSSLLKRYDHATDQNQLILGHKPVRVRRFDKLNIPSVSKYNCLVVDVEGYEACVLDGFGAQLDHIQMLSVELSRRPLFHKQLPASEVATWLTKKGFVQVTEIEDHNDVLFVRAEVLKASRWVPGL